MLRFSPRAFLVATTLAAIGVVVIPPRAAASEIAAALAGGGSAGTELAAGDTSVAKGPIEPPPPPVREESPAPVASETTGWFNDAGKKVDAAVDEERLRAIRRGSVPQWFSGLPAAHSERLRQNQLLLERFQALDRPLTADEQHQQRALLRMDELLRDGTVWEMDIGPQTRHGLVQFLADDGFGGRKYNPYTRGGAEWLYWNQYASPWARSTAGRARKEGGEGPANDLQREIRNREIPAYSSYGTDELSSHVDKDSEASRLFRRYTAFEDETEAARQAWRNASLWNPVGYVRAWRNAPDETAVRQRRRQLQQEFLQRAYQPGVALRRGA